MANITVKQIAALSKVKGTRKSIGGGLYFIVPKSGEPYWAKTKRKIIYMPL